MYFKSLKLKCVLNLLESIRIKLDRRHISKIVSMLLFLRAILELVSLWRFMGTVAMGIAVHIKARVVCQLLLLFVTLG